jgi:hypothetical protein
MRYDQVDCFNHNSLNTSPFWMIYGLFSLENPCGSRVRVAQVWVRVQPVIPASYLCHSLVVLHDDDIGQGKAQSLTVLQECI